MYFSPISGIITRCRTFVPRIGKREHEVGGIVHIGRQKFTFPYAQGGALFRCNDRERQTSPHFNVIYAEVVSSRHDIRVGIVDDPIVDGIAPRRHGQGKTIMEPRSVLAVLHFDVIMPDFRTRRSVLHNNPHCPAQVVRSLG